MCSRNRRTTFPRPAALVPAPIMFGEDGMTAMRYVGNDLHNDIVMDGDHTGQVYPFGKQNVIYVDDRDLPYMLGNELEFA